jgi:hypothetical protein
MAITKFLSEKWSALVELVAQETSIALRVTGGQYQVDAAGTTAIHTSRIVDGTIGDYDGTDITIEDLTDEGGTIAIDQKKYFAFYVDDVDVAQSQASIKDPAILTYTQKLALQADTKVFSQYNDAGIPAGNKIGAVASSIAITIANVDTYIYQMKNILAAQNAGKNRWLVVPTWFMSKLAQAGLDTQLGETNKDGIWKEGEVIRFAGFNIVESQSLAAVGAGSDEFQIMAYTDRALPLVAQVQKVTAGDSEKRFAEYVKGLYVFGTDVMFPKEVVVLSATEGAES